MALSEAQLNDLINSVVKKNNRNLIDGPKLNKVLLEIVDACFNTGSSNMANDQLDIEGDYLHSGNGHFWGISNLQQFYVSTASPTMGGGSISFMGYGSGADNQIFQVRNGSGNNAILTTGDLRTVFGGNISAGGSPWYAKVTGQTAIPTEYGVLGISQFNIGVRGASETSNGVQGESENNYGVYGVSSGNVGVFGISSLNTGVYAQSYSYVALQALSSSHKAAVMHGNTPSSAVEVVNNNTSGAGEGLRATASGGNVGIYGVGGNYGVAGEGISGVIGMSTGGGWGLKGYQNLGQGSLFTDGKVVMYNLSDSPLLTNEVYIYNDGTRKYLCIN